MFLKSELMKQLQEMEVPRDSVVLCHTSLRAIGETEGRGEGVLDALIAHCTADGGILLIPTHTWANLGKDGPTMEVTSRETCIGTLPNLAAVDPRATRSLHPTHSVAAFGRDAAAFTSAECLVDSSTSPKGCYGRIAEMGGKVLLIGVGHNRNTYLHSVEEALGVPNRMSKEMHPATIRVASGEIIERPLHVHSADGIGDVSARYPKYESAFRYHGCIRDGFFGNARAQLCDARGMAEVLRLVRERSGGRELLRDFDPLPIEYYMV